MIEFARVWAFVLLPLPFAAWRLLPPLPARAALRLPPGAWAFLDAAAGAGRRRAAALPAGPVLRALGWALLVAALAGPFVRGAALQTPTGRDLLVAVDLSASMSERLKGAGGEGAGGEGEVAAIEAVRGLVRDFVATRRGDRIGLIGFASDAYLVAPLTFDRDAVGRMLEEISIGLPGRRTDLGQAIGLAVRVLRRQPPGERVLALLSDGETNAGEIAALDAAELARQAGIVVHAIGFVDEGEDDGESPLRKVAAATGGRFFAAASAAELGAIHREIDKLAPAAARDERLVRDLTWIPLALALAALGGIAWREAREP